MVAANSSTSKAQFASALLSSIGAPVTQSNVNKLVLWMQHESGGGGGTYNPFDYVVKAPGSSAFNSVGVQNYPDVATGVTMATKMFRQKNMSEVTANLVAGGSWGDYLRAVVTVNAPWTSSAWQRGILSATEQEAVKYGATGINAPGAGVAPPAAQDALLGQHIVNGVELPNPVGSIIDMTGLGGGLPGGELNPLNHLIPSLSDLLHGDLSKLNPLNSVTDWLSSVLPTLLTGMVVLVGGVALVVIGAKRAMDPITAPMQAKAEQGAQTAALVAAV